MSEITPGFTKGIPLKRRLTRKLETVLLVFLLMILVHWLFFQDRERIPSVIVRLLGSCKIEWYGNKGGSLVLGCPHRVGLKFWSLPMEYPWFEEQPFEDPYFGVIIAKSAEAVP